jgi:biotin synthase
MALRLRSGRFYRDARPTCINLLLTYSGGCPAGCRYCGLGGATANGSDGDESASFIRVPWPVYGTDRILKRLGKYASDYRRVCISMVTHPKCFDDTLAVLLQVSGATERPISVLAAPSALPLGGIATLKEAGAGMLGVGLDAASERIFKRHRPAHSWRRYWESIEEAVEIFGQSKVSVHLMVGLGETDEELVDTIARLADFGALPHLFSFYPEPGSPMAKRRPPSLRRYRRLQLARHLLAERLARSDAFSFDALGSLAAIGASAETLEKALASPHTFMTNGCPSANGSPAGDGCSEAGHEIACNRPFANERPSCNIRNFPFPPQSADMEKILKQLRLAPASGR